MSAVKIIINNCITLITFLWVFVSELIIHCGLFRSSLESSVKELSVFE